MYTNTDKAFKGLKSIQDIKVETLSTVCLYPNMTKQFSLISDKFIINNLDYTSLLQTACSMLRENCSIHDSFQYGRYPPLESAAK